MTDLQHILEEAMAEIPAEWDTTTNTAILFPGAMLKISVLRVLVEDYSGNPNLRTDIHLAIHMTSPIDGTDVCIESYRSDKIDVCRLWSILVNQAFVKPVLQSVQTPVDLSYLKLIPDWMMHDVVSAVADIDHWTEASMTALGLPDIESRDYMIDFATRMREVCEHLKRS